MESPQKPTSSPQKVPDELVKQLHAANERFHEQKRQLEEKIDESDYDHGVHLGRAAEELKAAEREIEEIEKKIHDAMRDSGSAET